MAICLGGRWEDGKITVKEIEVEWTEEFGREEKMVWKCQKDKEEGRLMNIWGDGMDAKEKGTKGINMGRINGRGE